MTNTAHAGVARRMLRGAGAVACMIAALLPLLLVSIPLVLTAAIYLVLGPEGPHVVLLFVLLAGLLFVAPGLAVSRALGLRGSDGSLWLLWTVASGPAVSGLLIMFIYACGIYTRASLLVLLAGFALLGFWGIRAAEPTQLMSRYLAWWRHQSFVGWFVLMAISFFIAVSFLHALGAPYAGWDDLVSWDKWASDMAKRTALGSYLMGGYPQLMPSLYSAFYKILESSETALSSTQLLLHGVAPWFGVLLLLSLLRASSALGLSWILPVTLVFGASVVRLHTQTGNVDVPSTAFSAATLALTLSWIRPIPMHAVRRWMPTVAWGFLFFAVGFLKAHGLVWICLCFGAAVVGGLHAGPDRPRLGPLLGGAGGALLVLLLFYGSQYALAARPEWAEQSPFLHSLDFGLSDAGRATLSPGGLWDAARLVAFEFRPPRAWLDFLHVHSGWWINTAMGLFLLFGTLALVHRRIWFLALAGAAYFMIWFLRLSYDTRNLMPGLVLAGFAMAGGIERLAGRARGAIVGSALMGMLLSGGFAHAVMENSASVFARWTENLELWRTPQSSRLDQVNPRLAQARKIIDFSPLGRGAQHFYLRVPAYRYLGPRAVYLLKAFSLTGLAPGDLLFCEYNHVSCIDSFVTMAHIPALGFRHLGVHAPPLSDTPFRVLADGAGVRAVPGTPGPAAIQGRGSVALAVPSLARAPGGSVVLCSVSYAAAHSTATPLRLEWGDAARRLSSYTHILRPWNEPGRTAVLLWLDRGPVQSDDVARLFRLVIDTDELIELTNVSACWYSCEDVNSPPVLD